MPTRYATWQKERPRDGVDLVGMNESDSVFFCTPDFATFILDFRDRILSVLQMVLNLFLIKQGNAYCVAFNF